MGQDSFQIESYELITSAGIGGENPVIRILQLRSTTLAHGYYSTATIWGAAAFAGHPSGSVHYEPSSTEIVSVLAFFSDLALDELVNALNTNRGACQLSVQFDGDFGAQNADFKLQSVQIAAAAVTAGIGAAMKVQMIETLKKFPELKGIEAQLARL